MTKDELLEKVQGYEWTDLECKEASKEIPRNIYPTVSAFANTRGGWILFGIAEEHGRFHIKGVDSTKIDRMSGDFLNTLRSQQKLNQPIDAESVIFDIDGKKVLAFFIPENDRNSKPVYLRENPRNTYIRRGARNERATDREFLYLTKSAVSQHWDARILEDVDAAGALDEETIRWYISLFYTLESQQPRIDDPLEFLRKWNFLRDTESVPKLTYGGVLLFGTDQYVRRILSKPLLDYQRIDRRYDQWNSHERWDDRYIFEENLFKTWKALVTKYRRIAEHPFRLDPTTLRRIDDPPDYVAFREAAINLLIHQDYGDPHRTASLKVFVDRYVLWNPGEAYIDIDRIFASGRESVRNPALVDCFRRIGLSDQAGTGMGSIFHNWYALGYRHPSIDNNKQDKSFELVMEKTPFSSREARHLHAITGIDLTVEQSRLLSLACETNYLTTTDAAMAIGGQLNAARKVLDELVSMELLRKENDHVHCLTESTRSLMDEAIPADSSLEEPSHIPDIEAETESDIPDISPAVSAMIELLSTEEKSREELMLALDFKHPASFRKNYLQPGLSLGIIEMTIPEKPRSTRQKYRVTALGRKIRDAAP
ncbi:MAG: putative DNA binding domain-containing protein [Ectothiorhodospiraceae bacterium AqS1]|nr:putative DNA binding domain-containing protein [Ectothiorhodospiraceae bacterium AqS1]